MSNETGYDPRTETRAASVPLVNEIDSAKRCAEELAIVRARARGDRLRADAAPSLSWWGVGPEPPLFTRAEAMAGTVGVDFFPGDKCAVCQRVPWWNGRSIVVEHDAGAHRVADDDERATRAGVRDRGFSSPSALAQLAANQRVRRSMGERDDDA